MKKGLMLTLLLVPALELCACASPAAFLQARAEALGVPLPTTEPYGMLHPARGVHAAPTPGPKPTPGAGPQTLRPVVSYPESSPAVSPEITWYIPPTPTPVPPSPIGQQAADLALEYLGYDYAYGHEDPEHGFDCSGFVFYVYGQLGVPLNRSSYGMVYNGELVARGDQMQPGDILLFKNGAGYGHVGLYLGDGEYIHAMDVGVGVVISRVEDAAVPIMVRRIFPA